VFRLALDHAITRTIEHAYGVRGKEKHVALQVNALVPRDAVGGQGRRVEQLRWGRSTGGMGDRGCDEGRQRRWERVL
jgi:hypothetical protein